MRSAVSCRPPSLMTIEGEAVAEAEGSGCTWRDRWSDPYQHPGMLSMANDEHVALLKQGMNVWNEWRLKNPIMPDLSGANLSEANLFETILSGADLGGAILISVSPPQSQDRQAVCRRQVRDHLGRLASLRRHAGMRWQADWRLQPRKGAPAGDQRVMGSGEGLCGLAFADKSSGCRCR
jgi:hypothetical protein